MLDALPRLSRDGLLICACLIMGQRAFAQAPAIVTGPDAGGGVTVEIFTPMGTSPTSFAGAGAGFTGGVRVGAGDINGDGVLDVITGEGAGGTSTVRVFTGSSYTPPTYIFNPFGTVNLGVFVAGGDVNHDGSSDIVVGLGGGTGSAPQVKVISGADGSSVLANFFAFAANFTGGVTVGAGDVNGDGFSDIITAAASGSSAVKVFDGKTLNLIANFSAFAQSVTTGVFVAGGDVNHDGFADIIVGEGAGGTPEIRVFSGKDQSIIRDFFAFNVSFTGGVRVAGGDLNGDGFADIVAGAGPGGTSEVSIFNGQTSALEGAFLPYGTSNAGVFVAVPVPEPGSAALFLSGGVILVWRTKRGAR